MSSGFTTKFMPFDHVPFFRSAAEGGYEPRASAVEPQSEALLKAAIRQLLAVADDSPGR